MTTFAMIGGMLPTALALAKGSEWRSPMAIAVIGGLILSTMLTLLVIPAAYTIVDDWWGAIRRFLGYREPPHGQGLGQEDPAQQVLPE
jgi:HAE1 family hydrophobic/amphiphilic exporter-1